MQTIYLLPSVVSLAVIMIALSGGATTPPARKFVMKLGVGMFAALILIIAVLSVLLATRTISQPVHDVVLYTGLSLFFLVLVPVIAWANGRLAAMREKGG